jgi:hypothetical protein
VWGNDNGRGERGGEGKRIEGENNKLIISLIPGGLAIADLLPQSNLLPITNLLNPSIVAQRYPMFHQLLLP